MRTIIGVVGTEEVLETLDAQSLPGVAETMRITAPYKLVSAQNHARRTTVRVGGVPIGPDTFTLIAGPVRRRDGRADARVGPAGQAPPAPRCCAAAPSSPAPRRTRSRAWVSRACASWPRCATMSQLPVVTEVTDAADVAVVAEYADMLQIGTRNMQNFGLLQAVGAAGPTGHAQARPDGDLRGVADGGRVHRPARQPRHRAVRARRPIVRTGHPQHARRVGRRR